MNGWNEPIEFLARTPEALEQLAPIWKAMDENQRGDFYVPSVLVEQARSLKIEAIGLRASVNQPLEAKPPATSAPLVTCNYRDLRAATYVNGRRPQIHLQEYDFRGAAHNKVQLFLTTHELRREWIERTFTKKPCLLVDGAEMTASAIMNFVNGRSELRFVDILEGESIGILYMSFGEKAAKAVQRSVRTLRRVGLQIPVCVVGDTPVNNFQFIEWTGESPFDPRERRNFQFRAGRIKPKLIDLTPFDRTLYVDADTEFMADILPGFQALGECDIVVTQEMLTLKQLYNKKLAGWEINLIERDATIEELGGDPNVYFWNSGVMFFRKSRAAKEAMNRWHEEWMRWQQWDEQLALMRALHKTPDLRLKMFDATWNYPHKRDGIVIFHNYGRGVVRMNVSELEAA